MRAAYLKKYINIYLLYINILKYKSNYKNVNIKNL